MNRKEFLMAGAAAFGLNVFADDSVATAEKPEAKAPEGFPLEKLQEAVSVIDSTTMFDAEKRAPALETIQRYIDQLKGNERQFEFFHNHAGADFDAERVKKAHTLYPIFWYYDHAAEKVLKEFRETEVTGDIPAIWYVYNMGIVIKTKTKAFSIDLSHRLGARFAPFLDFALITHAHPDHYSRAFVEAMAKCGAHIVSNFILDRYFYCNTDGTDRDYDGIKIHITQGDHNKALPKAINCYEVTFTGEPGFTIFHSGDLHRSAQLRPVNPHPDIYMAHCQIGLNMTSAYQTTMPAKLMLPMHHQELGHISADPKRNGCVPFTGNPAKYVREITALGGKAAMPVWGDRIV